MCITLFCTFFSRRCTTSTWNFLISLARFMKKLNTIQKFSFSNLRYCLLGFNSRKFHQHLTKFTAVASMRRTEALASVKFYQILSIFIFFIRLIILEDFIRLISYNGPCVRLGCSFFLATALKLGWKLIRSMNFETVRFHFLGDFFGLLSSRNVATMATWRKDFSSLFGNFMER